MLVARIKQEYYKLKKILLEDTDDGNDRLVMVANIERFYAAYGLWPKTGFKLYQIVPLLLSLHIFTVGSIGHLIHYLKNNPWNFFAVADDICMSISLCLQTVIYLVFITHFKYFRKGVIEYGDFRKYKKPRKIERINNIFNLLSVVINVFLALSVAAMILILVPQQCHGEDSDCGLVFTAHLPFINVLETPARQIYCVLQLYNGATCVVLGLNLILFGTFLNEALIAYIDEFKEMVNALKTLKKREDRKQQMNTIINYHYRILELYDLYMKMGKYLYMVLLAASAAMISFTSYELLGKGYTYPAFLHGMSYIGASFLACFFGQRLINETDILSDVIINSIPWDGDLLTQKDLLILLKNVEEPLSNSAGGFAIMNYGLFINIIKTAYSYLMLMMETGN